MCDTWLAISSLPPKFLNRSFLLCKRSISSVFWQCSFGLALPLIVFVNTYRIKLLHVYPRSLATTKVFCCSNWERELTPGCPLSPRQYKLLRCLSAECIHCINKSVTVSTVTFREAAILPESPNCPPQDCEEWGSTKQTEYSSNLKVVCKKEGVFSGIYVTSKPVCVTTWCTIYMYLT